MGAEPRRFIDPTLVIRPANMLRQAAGWMDDRQVQPGLSNANPSRSSNIAGAPPRPVDLGCFAENAFTRNRPEVPAIEAVGSIVAADEITFVRDDVTATV